MIVNIVNQTPGKLPLMFLFLTKSCIDISHIQYQISQSHRDLELELFKSFIHCCNLSHPAQYIDCYNFMVFMNILKKKDKQTLNQKLINSNVL